MLSEDEILTVFKELGLSSERDREQKLFLKTVFSKDNKKLTDNFITDNVTN